MQSAKYNILIETGTDFAMPFTVYDDNDMPMDLTDARIEAHLREFEASPDYFEFSCINNGAGGRITITLPHETTSQIPYSYGVYDVKVEFPNGSIAYPLYGDVKVRNGITKSNDGTILFMVGINSFDDLPEVGSVNRMYYDYTNRIIYRWNGQNYVSAFYGGIADIHLKEHVDEYTDCYTIVYDNGQEFDFYVTAKGVYSVEKISSEGNIFSGIVDTYRMTFNTGTYVDYQITNGRMDVEAGIDIEYKAPETLVINTTDNTGKYAPKDGNAYVQRNGEWNKINHDISSDSNGVKIKVDWDSDINNIPQTFPPTAHNHDDQYYTETEVDDFIDDLQDQIDNINKFAIHICTSGEYDPTTFIPTVTNPKENTFYLVPTGTGTDMYAEWIYKNNKWEKFGVNSIDLNAYYTKTETDALLDTKQNTLTFDNVPTAGSNNPVKSSGIKSALDEKANSADVYSKTETDALLDAKENTIIKSASGPIVSFNDGIEAPAGNVTVAIEPVQEGSGDPSPSNVRPITGWTGVKVCRTGKNLLDTKNYAPTNTTSSGITLVQNQDGSFKASGTATGTVNIWLRGAYGYTNPVFKLYAGKTYFIKDVMLYRGTSQIGPTVYIGASGTYTPSADIEITGIRVSCPVGTTLDTTIYPYITDSTDTEWQEFGTTYSITFPSEAGTVYGGSLDVSSGKLTVTHGFIELQNLSSLAGSNWRKSGNALNGFYIQSAFINPIMQKTTHVISSHFRNATDVQEYYNTYGTVILDLTINFNCDPAICGSTAENFQQWLENQKTAGTPVELWYKMTTPRTYQLTPTEVTTLLGQNNIWADTGDVDVSYFTSAGEDIGKAFDNVSKSSKYDDDKTREMLTQSSESAMTASKNYTAGSLVIVQNQLLRITQNIATGGAITIGSNAEHTTIEALLAEIRSVISQ